MGWDGTRWALHPLQLAGSSPTLGGLGARCTRHGAGRQPGWEQPPAPARPRLQPGFCLALLGRGGFCTRARLRTPLLLACRIVCQTGEAPEVFSDVVTVNVSREGKSKERYSYVVSDCLLDASSVTLMFMCLIPLKKILEPSGPPLA